MNNLWLYGHASFQTLFTAPVLSCIQVTLGKSCKANCLVCVLSYSIILSLYRMGIPLLIRHENWETQRCVRSYFLMETDFRICLPIYILPQGR